MLRDLPAGTVTFLFTDVESSTKLLHELGAERYGDALAEHRRVIREACAAEGGVEVDTQGDAFFFAFARAPAALAAANAFVERLASGPIQVRVGLHTGTPFLTEEGYVGGDVHRAARIAAAGHGGQVLVSASTASLVERDLRDLGEHRFKDLAAAERVFQLGAADFPPLRSLYRTNLPIPVNPLLGREKQLVDVLRLLRDATRVVTITGAGGVGKTRFALAAAAEASDGFPDGIWFVDLSAVRDTRLVLPTIAHAVQADGELSEYLHGSACLLLLDNFEQVVDAAGDIAALVTTCSEIRILTTSRESLRIAPEHEYPLSPLPESPAVQLFRHRTAAVVPDAEVEYGVAAEICRRLDGLPLAIELAAARVKVFEPAALLAKLDDRLPVLVTRARDLPERQRALHATIEWSYELLDPDERQLFRRLAVFRGGALLEAIEVVADATPDFIEALVDKSLVRRRRGRFVMLETIREFARNELEESEEGNEVRRRHARHYAAIAEGANLDAGNLRPGGQRLEVAIAEQDNIRAALSWAISAGEIAVGLRIAIAMEQFWVVNDPPEGARWFSVLFDSMADEDAVEPELRARALRAWGSSASIVGDDDTAIDLYSRSLALHEQLGDDHGRAVLLHRLGIHAMLRGELERARALVRESHAIHEAADDTWGLVQTIGTLGALARDAGDGNEAYELIGESAVLALDAGVVWWHQGMLIELAALSLEAGRTQDAESKARESLSIAREIRDYGGRVFGVGVLACVAAVRGEVDRAGRLWGAIENDVVGAPLGGWIRHRASCEARITEVAGAQLDAALAVGRDLSLDQAVELALADA